jgi:hypothetical protein
MELFDDKKRMEEIGDIARQKIITEFNSSKESKIIAQVYYLNIWETQKQHS